MLDEVVLRTVRKLRFMVCKHRPLSFWRFFHSMEIEDEVGKTHSGFRTMIPYHITAALSLEGKPSSIHAIILKTGYHFETIKRHLAGLCEEGIVKKVPSGGFKYVLVAQKKEGENQLNR